MAVSDGSYREGVGTAAWCIAPANFDPGSQIEQSSFCGIYTILLMLLKLCEFAEFRIGQVTIGCDGESALHMASPLSSCGPKNPCVDFIMAIHKLLHLLPIDIKFRHIKGHQDVHSPVDSLDNWAKLNIQMDSAAKGALNWAGRQNRFFDIPYEPWSIWHNNGKISLKFYSTMCGIVHGPPAMEYWNKMTSLELLQSIDWEAISIAKRTVQRSKGTFITKHCAGMCGVGKFKKHWKERDTDDYPRCGAPEVAQHVWVCQGYDSQLVWTKSIKKLAGWLHEVGTSPDIVHCYI